LNVHTPSSCRRAASLLAARCLSHLALAVSRAACSVWTVRGMKPTRPPPAASQQHPVPKETYKRYCKWAYPSKPTRAITSASFFIRPEIAIRTGRAYARGICPWRARAAWGNIAPCRRGVALLLLLLSLPLLLILLLAPLLPSSPSSSLHTRCCRFSRSSYPFASLVITSMSEGSQRVCSQPVHSLAFAHG
jgi:hypothetical protein